MGAGDGSECPGGPRAAGEMPRPCSSAMKSKRELMSRAHPETLPPEGHRPPASTCLAALHTWAPACSPPALLWPWASPDSHNGLPIPSAKLRLEAVPTVEGQGGALYLLTTCARWARQSPWAKLRPAPACYGLKEMAQLGSLQLPTYLGPRGRGKREEAEGSLSTHLPRGHTPCPSGPVGLCAPLVSPPPHPELHHPCQPGAAGSGRPPHPLPAPKGPGQYDGWWPPEVQLWGHN